MLTSVPAMRAVARAFPDHERLLAAPQSLGPLVMLSGAVDRVVDSRPLQPLSEECQRPEVAVDLHGRGPASHRILLATQPRRLIAFANDEIPESAGFPAWRESEHEVKRWCRMLAESGIVADPSDLDLDPPRIPPPAIARNAVVIHPGAAHPARRWPGERWSQVARALSPEVVITGSASERELASQIALEAGLASSNVLAGRTSSLELAAVIASARLLISGDTGVAHLATALRVPSVLLFGPTPPSRWGPPPERYWHRVLWKGREGDPNAMEPDAGLLAITVEEVLDAVASLTAELHAVRAH
jgi:ADP-heptose:LPS heptosyltransferase